VPAGARSFLTTTRGTHGRNLGQDARHEPARMLLLHSRCRAALARASRHSVINVVSTSAITGEGSSIVYAASKAGMLTMTKSLARALAPQIRVNAISPGLIRTHFADRQESDRFLQEKRKPLLSKSWPPSRTAPPLRSFWQRMLRLYGANDSRRGRANCARACSFGSNENGPRC